VRDVVTDPSDLAIVSAIIAMARHLHIEVVAEGIEGWQQLEKLRQLGCTYAQGYLFARPRRRRSAGCTCWGSRSISPRACRRWIGWKLPAAGISFAYCRLRPQAPSHRTCENGPCRNSARMPCSWFAPCVRLQPRDRCHHTFQRPQDLATTPGLPPRRVPSSKHLAQALGSEGISVCAVEDTPARPSLMRVSQQLGEFS